MASSSFTFTLEFNGPGVHVPLLEQLADALLQHLGCSKAAVVELTAALEHAVTDGVFAGTSSCGVRFQKQGATPEHGATLDILVSADGGRVWQTSCALP